MATPSQIEANRLNALKSTGPRSTEGKETSRFNALKNGIEAESLILPGEDPERLAALTRNYLVQFLPVGPVEERLVRSLTLSDWYQERFARIEAKIVALSLDPALDYDSAVAMLYAGKDGYSLALRHVFRRQQAAQREWTNSLKELQRLRTERKACPEEPVADTQAAAPTFPASEQPDREPTESSPIPHSKPPHH